MFLVIFASLLGSAAVHLGTLTVKESTYYVAAMAAYGVIAACYSNIATAITYQREAGILKRTNGTPLPSVAFLAARVIRALLVAVLLMAVGPPSAGSPTARRSPPGRACSASWSCSPSAPPPSARSPSR